ncbi:hypothetical protein [Phascolarctobacterium faecium]|jgi:hypothetical protein
MGHKRLATTEGYIDNYIERTEQKNISLAAENLNKQPFFSIS